MARALSMQHFRFLSVLGLASSSPVDAGVDLPWLLSKAERIIEGCRIPILPTSPLNHGINATWAFTPDASHGYGAQWTRDFYYLVHGAPELLDEKSVKQSVRYTFAGQRADGCMPDRVQTDGMSVMAPGPMMPNNTKNPQHDHAWDNGPFAALLLATTIQAWPDRELFCELEPAARKALDFVNRSANFLVYNDIDYPNATYGFTDTIAKTGNLLFSSLLYLDASQQLAALSKVYACGDAHRYAEEARQVSGNMDLLKDPHGPLWLAASHDNSFPDVWGSAYLVMLNASSPERRKAAMDEMVRHKSTYFLAGQVRSLPYPMYWSRCCWTPGCAATGQTGCAPRGTYQNGAFWATPLSYVTPALIQTGYTAFASTLLQECVADFKLSGVYEDVNYGHPAQTTGVLNYTASITNVLRAAEQLQLHQQRQAVPEAQWLLI